MKIVLDTDGTLTDFNKFIKENAIEYFKNNYGMEVIYPKKLEIEDIFDIKNVLINEKNYTEKQAELEMKKMLDKFWISLRFVKFSLCTKFRNGVPEIINEFIRQGHDIQVHTSRAKTCNNDIVGEIARKFTIWQYRMNGIWLSKDKFHFYANDEEKIKGIIAEKPEIAFDDKPEIIRTLNKNNIKTICVAGTHNENVVESKQTEKISEFNKQDLAEKMNRLLNRKLEIYNREASSNNFYKKIRLSIPLILKIFNPLVLNAQNLKKTDSESIIYAPNHQTTIDPLIINAYLDENIHWAALERFFEGKDSIFNNNKNPLLCKITSESFKKLEYFPIVRKSDDQKANNLNSIKDMDSFLKIKSKIGIFAEGTTRRPEGSDFGTFDSSFLALAKRNKSYIQPITLLWIKEVEMEHKLIINFGEPFKVDNIEKAMEHFLQIQASSLEENKKIRDELIHENIKLMKKI